MTTEITEEEWGSWVGGDPHALNAGLYSQNLLHMFLFSKVFV